MNWQAARSFLIRQRVTLGDLALLGAVMAVAAYVAFDVDIFMYEGQLTPHGAVIELDEMALLGCLLAIGLLAFGWRRYAEQKREVKRRMAAEAQARALAYEDVLTGLCTSDCLGGRLYIFFTFGVDITARAVAWSVLRRRTGRRPPTEAGPIAANSDRSGAARWRKLAGSLPMRVACGNSSSVRSRSA